MRKEKLPFNQLMINHKFLCHKNFVLIVVILLLVCSYPNLRSVGASAGGLDPTFGAGGKVTTNFSGHDNAYDLAIQQDGKIVAVGFADFGGDFAVARYNSDGSPDSSFGSGGKVILDFFGTGDEASAVSIQSDSKIVVAGRALINSSNGDAVFAMARFNPDGSLDTSFGIGGKVTTDFSTSDDSCNDMVIQADGKIILAGYATNTTPGLFTRDFALARYNPNGSLDTGFGSGGMVITDFYLGRDEINSLALQSDGKIVVAGVTAPESNDSSPTFTVARYNPDGSLDAAFGSGGAVITDFPGMEDRAYAVVIQDDGKIVAAGSAEDPTSFSVDFVLARYSSDGGFDTTFGNGGIVVTDFFGDWDTPLALALQPDGRLVAAGSAAIDGLDDFALARYNTDGSLDATFSTDGKTTTDFSDNANNSSVIQAIAFQADGRVVAAGVSERGDFTLARYLGDTSSNTPVGNNIVVQPVDSTSGTTPGTLTFDTVTQQGNTSLTTSNSGPMPPAGFQIGDPSTYYELTTTAVFSGSIGVCINYTGISFTDESNLRLFHFENSQWVDVTSSLNTTTNVICGSTNSLSPFAIFQRVYQFSGFFSPVANPPTINVVNAGSAVPLKFSLSGNQGLDIFAAGYPVSQVINCDTASPYSNLEATVTAGSSSLSYDAGTDRYTYVWKTDKAWAGSCRQLIVKLKDGTQRTAYFKFK